MSDSDNTCRDDAHIVSSLARKKVKVDDVFNYAIEKGDDAYASSLQWQTI
jgi:hypothetical protein